MARTPRQQLAHWLAVWFGCGHVPIAPGTAGTVGAIPLYSAGAAGFALLLVALFYFPDRSAGRNESETKIESKTLRGVLDDLKVVLRNRRFLALVLITAGYWTIQGQLYASMPKFVLRMVGEDASPEWYAKIGRAHV